MRMLSFCALYLAVALPGFAQTAANAGPPMPTDAREIFAAAAPFYDFNSPELKPWHLKASYQLYDDEGKPGEKGTYEYWWASPKVYRSTWTRPSATHSEWHTADGKHAHQDIGEPLKFFEYKLQAALFSPLPTSAELAPDKFRLDKESLGKKNAKVPCIMVIPLMPTYKDLKTAPLGLYPTYCFDTQMPVLRASRSFGTLTTEFNNIAITQNRYLAREILVFEGKRKILSATIDTVSGIAPSDPALTPPVEARITQHDNVQLGSGILAGMLLKKQTPSYPLYDKEVGVSGTVVLKAIIGRDGGIHDLRVISAPTPSMALSALWAVSQWEYRPYLLNGEPVEVNSTINVIYTLGK